MSKTVKTTKKTKKRKHSFILTVVLVSVCISFAISFVSLRSQINETSEEIKAINTECENQNAKNAEMQNMLDEDDIDSYVESVARNKLGYVMPGEKVYCDESVGQ